MLTDKPYTIDDVLSRLQRPSMSPLPVPAFNGPVIEQRMSVEASMRGCETRVGLAVESMKRHTTDEGWQIFQGLEHQGWHLSGFALDNLMNIPQIINQYEPGTLLVQDKREWDVLPRDFRDRRAMFSQVYSLKQRGDIFKLTILKDAQQRPNYHAESADEIGCHAWVIYYHPRIVSHLAPYVRRQHLIRTYHTLNNDIVPTFRPKAERVDKALLSGAVSNAYPLRQRLFNQHHQLPNVEVLKHPGYHRDGCHTPAFLHTLSRYKVAICTASMYGYALRKMMEATACGCRVITDLPIDEKLPVIDGNLIRVQPDITLPAMTQLIDEVLATYDEDFQRDMSNCARTYYDYRHMTLLLDRDILTLRQHYQTLSKEPTRA